MRRVISVPLAIALSAALTACAPREDAMDEGSSGDTLAAADQPAGGIEPAAPTDSVPPELVGTAWRLVEFDAGEPVPEGVEITALFEPGRMAGAGGCNRYTGPVSIDLAAGTLQGGPMVSTKMACPPPRMENETRYLGALQRATGIALEPGRLTIRSEDEAGGTSTLAFVPAEEAPAASP